MVGDGDVSAVRARDSREGEVKVWAGLQESLSEE